MANREAGQSVRQGMRLVAVGGDSPGVLAIGPQAIGVFADGQFSTGIFAFGQVATGVIAIGQVARGGIAVGQAGRFGPSSRRASWRSACWRGGRAWRGSAAFAVRPWADLRILRRGSTQADG